MTDAEKIELADRVSCGRDLLIERLQALGAWRVTCQSAGDHGTEPTLLQALRAAHSGDPEPEPTDMKYTPGPWHWYKQSCSAALISGPIPEPGDCIDDSIIIDDGSAGGEYEPRIDVDGPNARLIAAAPDMLAALLEVLADDTGECGHLTCVFDAIEKATGERP